MHRSGTSLCARLLGALGVDIADDVGVGPGNEEGHWERWELVDLHNQLLAALNRANGEIAEYAPLHDLAFPPAWWARPEIKAIRSRIEGFLDSRMPADELFGFKDPRVTRLLPLWSQILERKQLAPRYVLCVRNPAEVAASLWKRDRIPHAAGAYRWMLYNCDFISNAPDDHLVVSYDDWFEAPERAAERLAAFVGVELPRNSAALADILRSINSDRRHNISSDPSQDDQIGRLYALLRSGEAYARKREEAKAIADGFSGFARLVPFEDALDALQSKNRITAEQAEHISRLDATVAERDRAIGQLKQRLDAESADGLNLRHLLQQQTAAANESLERIEKQAARNVLLHVANARGFRPNGWLRSVRDYTLIRGSRLFQSNWYAERYPESPRGARRRLWHFLNRGWLLGNNPNWLFDTAWYLSQYPDVLRSGVNPVIHYLTIGAAEGRDPGPKFDTAKYLAANPEARAGGLTPLGHHLAAVTRRKAV